MVERAFLIFSGANDRAVLALIRAFSECSVKFAIIARNSFDTVAWTAYADHVCVVRQSDELDATLLAGWVASARARFPGAELVLVPSSEYLNTFLLGLEPEFLRIQLGCILPLVDASVYARLSNKMSSIQYFAGFGVAAPKQLDVSEVKVFPVVAKPFRNVGADQIVRYPIIIGSSSELTFFRQRQDFEEFFLQEYVVGKSYYLLIYISADGRIFSSSQLNSGQQSGGKSIVMAETASFHKDEASSRVLAALAAVDFRGFAMVEFIVSGQRKHFIEMNPRVWGPLQLVTSHDCGIVEAFIGDYAHSDPNYYDHIRRSKPERARYLWLGGVLAEIRSGRRVRWAVSSGVFRKVLSYLASDVYFRRDSWRIFVRGFFK